MTVTSAKSQDTPRLVDLPDEAATMALADRLARIARPGDVIALAGDLGSGKTSFARAFVRALGDGEEEVPSPTFTLVQTYDVEIGIIWHFDLYRLNRADEVWELGFEEALIDGIVLIEWPDRLGGLLPAQHLRITFEPGPGPTARTARIEGTGAWRERVGAFVRG